MTVIKGRKLFERALAVPEIQEATNRFDDHETKILFLSVCYQTLGKMILSMEHQEQREAAPLDVLIAAVGLIHRGDFELVEEGDTVAALPVEKTPKE